MNTTVIYVSSVIAVVVIVALVLSSKVEVLIQWKKEMMIKFRAWLPFGTSKTGISSKSRTAAIKGHHVRQVFCLNQKPIMAAILVTIMVGTPAFWWFSQPMLWRALVATEGHKFVSLLTHGSKEAVQTSRGQETLNQITELLDILTDDLHHNQYKKKDIWVLDHYWQYWNTSNLNEYMRANKMFVAQGGRIHRMFLLTDEDMQNPEVQNVLQAQCQIGRISNDQTGNGFELWRADPRLIKNQEEYVNVARSFQQLPGTEKNFEDFDLVRFQDVLYYSSDFSPDYRVMGSSNLIFDPDQAGKIDLSRLFRKSIAQRISCDQAVPALRAAKD